VTQPSVSIRGLSKAYAIAPKAKIAGVDHGQLGALKSLLAGRPNARATNDVLALQNIDLDVMPGEVLGVIGRNGAGKSTLLKLLARVIDPSAGRVELRGRVASLLELGLGFAPELTLRENIRLYARLSGLGLREAIKAEDRILEFAELTEFRDLALEKCPSGAFIRLAFSAMVNMQADIILADEVLAVGDSAYRHACEERIRNAPITGETILFVSHDMNAIRRICTRVVWIDHGAVRMTGDTGSVVSAYETELLGGALDDEHDANAPCRILDLRLLGDDHAPVGALQMEAPAYIDCAFRLAQPTSAATVEMQLWRGSKLHVLTALCPERFNATRPTTFRTALKIPADFLNEAEYIVKCRVLQRQGPGEPDSIGDEQSLTFQVFNTSPERSVWADWRWGRAGLIAPRLDWSATPAEQTYS